MTIDADTCTGCKKCITSIGCPGIGFDEGLRGPKSGGRGQAFVDTSLCDGCGLCTQVCSFNAIQGAVGFGGAVPAEPAIYAPNPDPFQTGPIPRVLTDEMNDFQETEIAGEPERDALVRCWGQPKGCQWQNASCIPKGRLAPWRDCRCRRKEACDD